jgi:hypothetical protein
MLNLTHISIPFDARRIAQAVEVEPDASPAEALAALRLPPVKGVIVMHGGAGGMDPVLVNQVRRFLEASVARFADEHRILVIDGGTRSGSMQAMGEARRRARGTYPLLGVCPHGVVGYPNGPALDGERVPLEPSHSHFIFVDSDEFGAESDLMVGLLQATGKPGLALIVNGGNIVAKEALAHARAGNPLVTVRGSGRVADELADPNSERRAALPPGTRLEIANLHAPEQFQRLLKRLLKV